MKAYSKRIKRLLVAHSDSHISILEQKWEGGVLKELGEKGGKKTVIFLQPD